MNKKNNFINISLISSFLFYIITLYLNEWFAINSPNFEENQKPLFDRGQEIFLYKISGKIPSLILTITMIYFLIRWGLTNSKVLSNYFVLVGILFIIRVFVFMSTITPSPLNKCGSNNTKWDLNNLKWLFIEKDDTCIDNMFSGHTVHITAIFLFTLYFSTFFIEKIIIGILALLIMITLIWSRLHYTSDVLVGFFMTIGYFFSVFKFDKLFI